MNGVCLRFDLIRVSESVACTEVEGKVYCMLNKCVHKCESIILRKLFVGI